MAPQIAFITFAHKRPFRLRRTLKFALDTIPKQTGVQTRVVLVEDRPSALTKNVIAKWRDHERVLHFVCPFPIVSAEQGQLWTAARNLAALEMDRRGWEPEWVSNFDEDWEFGPGWSLHLRRCLENPDAWSWRAVNLFLWDSRDRVNVRQRHDSPLFGRYRRGWRRDPEMTNQTCVQVEQHVAQYPEAEQYLPFFLLDDGTLEIDERTRMFKAYMAAGKQCDFVRNYIRPPIVKPLDELLQMTPEEYSRCPIV